MTADGAATGEQAIEMHGKPEIINSDQGVSLQAGIHRISVVQRN